MKLGGGKGETRRREITFNIGRLSTKQKVDGGDRGRWRFAFLLTFLVFLFSARRFLR